MWFPLKLLLNFWRSTELMWRQQNVNDVLSAYTSCVFTQSCKPALGHDGRRKLLCLTSPKFLVSSRSRSLSRRFSVCTTSFFDEAHSLCLFASICSCLSILCSLPLVCPKCHPCLTSVQMLSVHASVCSSQCSGSVHELLDTHWQPLLCGRDVK